MIKNIEELTKFVKMDVAELQKALTSEEEITLEFNDGQLVTDKQIETLKEGSKKEGNTIGYDFAIKDLKKLAGLEYDGKDKQVLLDKLQETFVADAKVEPDKKVKEARESLKKLQGTYTSDINKKDVEILTLNSKINSMENNQLIISSMPEIKGVTKSDAAVLFSMNHSIENIEGVNIVSKNGMKLEDNLSNPIPLSEITQNFAQEKGWTNFDGKGGEDNKGGSSTQFKTQHEAMKHMESNNINPVSAEGEKILKSIN